MATIVTLQSSDLISNSRADINTSLANLNSDKIETSVLDTDTALAANSDAKVATQKATKAYVDAANAATQTSGVSAGPGGNETQTITHGLGRIPSRIRITAFGEFTANASARIYSSSVGTYNASGNRCLYIDGLTTTHGPTTSTTFAVFLDINDGSAVATGVIQNVTSTSFDIVWTAPGSMADGSFMWEAS